MMNIYWFASDDSSVVEPVLAPNEEAAWKVLSAKEDRLPVLEDYKVAGVSENVGEGEPRALADILGLTGISELAVH